MKIRGNEAENLNETLKETLKFGLRYVSLDTGKGDEYFRADSMHYFDTKSEVQHHNYMRHTIDQQYREALPILSLQEELQQKIELQKMTRSPGSELKDIFIDTGLIHYLEKARLEIFEGEISGQLREQNIKPDLKQLQEHIRRDDHQFSIAGTRRENGTEKPYAIQIEQNEHRAFLIRDIAAQQTIEEQKSIKVMIERAEGFVLKDDAREIRDMMRKELENGNRFVTMPAAKEGLTKDDFKGFKSALEALQYAYENTTERIVYGVGSTSVVEKEMSRVVEGKEQQQDKLKENERETKPSRDQDRSR